VLEAAKALPLPLAGVAAGASPAGRAGVAGPA